MDRIKENNDRIFFNAEIGSTPVSCYLNIFRIYCANNDKTQGPSVKGCPLNFFIHLFKVAEFLATNHVV